MRRVLFDYGRTYWTETAPGSGLFHGGPAPGLCHQWLNVERTKGVPETYLREHYNVLEQEGVE